MPSCNKLYYFVHLDEKNYPIPGTMFAKSTAASNPCSTKIAPLTGATMTAPAGQIQCFPSNGFRYWYQLDSSGAILPNSMIAVKGVPSRAGTGGRPCQFIEYKVFKSA
jgi:hypothetical protein